MDFEQRKSAFVALGQELSEALRLKDRPENLNIRQQQLLEIGKSLHQFNGWFTPFHVENALKGISLILQKESLDLWLSSYLFDVTSPKTVGIVMAGNIPAVGFHDFLCVLLSGHQAKIKLSSVDSVLIPALAAMLSAIEPRFAERIHFTSERIGTVDAIIATGSNNSSRYFEYYFGKYPHIIRKNRTSVAVIKPDESSDNMEKLYKDIFLYFGMGCRNVTKLFVPETFDFIRFLDGAEKWNYLSENNKYMNNYNYNKAIYLVNGIAHYDNGFILLKADSGLHPPVSVLYYETYNNPELLRKQISEIRSNLQCIVSSDSSVAENTVSFGNTQFPGPADYADNIDTIKFLLGLS
jgi:hypothetical protein